METTFGLRRSVRFPIAPLLCLCLALLASACGQDSDEASSEGQDQAGESQNANDRSGDEVQDGGGDEANSGFEGSWILTAGTVDGTDLTIDPTYPITIEFTASEVGGSAGCNTFGGQYSFGGTAVSLTELFSTEMACEAPEIMTTESQYLNALSRVTSAEQSGQAGDQLELSADGVSLVFERQEPAVAAPLTGTTWTLDTLIDGDAASTVPAGAKAATLTFAGDGTFTGSTGCRDLNGTYTTGDGTVSFAFDGDDFACEGPNGEQDFAVLEVLQQPTLTIGVDGQRLTLTSATGVGLSFQAS